MAKKEEDLVEALQASLRSLESSGGLPRRARDARSPKSEESAFVERQVERLREQLLDLSNRNRLLNFKHPQKSRKQIRVIDELPAVLYQRLITGRTFRFKAVDEPTIARGVEIPVAEAARQQGLNPEFTLGAAPKEAAPEHHLDSYIQVLHYPTEMAKRLEGIRQEHLTSLQELGVPSLYVVFGFLEWYERQNSDSPLLSPLVLVPLEIERSRERGLYQYRVAATSEEPEPNRTLDFRLRQDIGLTLPNLDALIEHEDLDRHFAEVEAAIAAMPHWRLRRYVTVCAVSFARQVMYEDLAPERWQQRGGRASGLLRGLLAGAQVPEAAAEAPRFEGPLLVTDSDSTQIAAIADALAGRSLVVKGPPGTGKSQTITNLIAAALAENKRVLFVAEKMAALDVVKKRLDDAGLANFCLALHSTRAKKREVLDALDKSMKARADSPERWAGREPRRDDRLNSLKELESYLAAVSERIGDLDLDARQVVWREQKLRAELGSVPPELSKLAVPNADTIDAMAMQECMRLLSELEAAARNVKQPTTQAPWAFVTTWDPTQHSVEGLVASAANWVQALRTLVAPLAEHGWPVNDLALDDLKDLAEQLADLSHAEENAPTELVGKLLSNPLHCPDLLRLAGDLEARSVQARRVEGICDVEQALPHRSRLMELMRDLGAARLVSDGMTYGDVKPRIEEQRASMMRLKGVVGVLRARATALRLPTPWDMHAQTVVLEAGVLAAAAGADILRRRFVAALEEGARATLERTAQDALRLRAGRAELDEVLTGWDKIGSVELRRHATVLRTTGFFGRLFGSAFKSSRTAYLSMSTGRVATRNDMAALLQRAAEQLEAEEKSISASRVRRLCGDAYDGLATDFDPLVRMALWAEAVRQSFPGEDDLSRWAREALFTGSASELLSLAESQRSVEREFSPGDRAAVDLEQMATSVLSALQRADASYAGVIHLGLDSRTLLRELMTVASALEQVATHDARIDVSPARAFIGSSWQGSHTDPRALRASVSAAETVRDIAFPSFVSEWLVREDFSSKVRYAIALGRGVAEGIIMERQARDHARASGITVADLESPGSSVRSLIARLELAISSGNEVLAAHLRYVIARAACASNSSLDAFCRAVEELGLWRDLPRRFEWVVLRTLAGSLMRQQPRLVQEGWSGSRLAQLRETVRKLEDEATRYRRIELAAELSSEEVPAGKRTGARKDWTDGALITHEIGKSKRNIPIRALMSRAHDAILALTPCLMMSPLSIAQFLEEPDLQFDMLIVDEASQLRPEEALGGLLRARQLVVVGDEQQLPPTSFFKRTDEEALEDDDYEDVEAESLLDLAMNAFGTPRVLRWHYRSRHESLIGFSNAEFYRNELVVAPSPRSPGAGIGVSMDYVRGIYQSSVNPPEAERVVQLTFELMKKHPKRSIGVVAINQQQADLIRDLVDASARDDEVKYVESWKNTLEPFFVKNLENVQGDERDIIVISMTYGPDPTGRVYQRFGPIVGKYGHRRLNVLFSRAKHQLLLVTSMKAEDVRVDGGGNRGIQVLRSYLEYAAVRTKAAPEGRKEHSFGRLADEISDLGFDVVPAVGSQSLKLDLGVVHPDDPTGFVAAVEVDAGDTEGRMKSADRELIRPLVLGRLEWSVVQVWTSDWLREPAVARTRLREGLAEACRRAKRPMPAPRAKVMTKEIEEAAALPSGSLATAPPPLDAELCAGDRILGRFEVHGSRIRIGRGGQCEIRVPDDMEEVAAQHMEIRWDHSHFSITEIDPRAGVYADSTRLSVGPLVRGRTHTVRLGLGRVSVRLAYGAPLAQMDVPASGAGSMDLASTAFAGLAGQLAAHEHQFLTLLVENGQVRTTELVDLLGKPALRVNGMVRELRRRLHDAGVPPLFDDVRLPNGEVMYRRLS